MCNAIAFSDPAVSAPSREYLPQPEHAGQCIDLFTMIAIVGIDRECLLVHLRCFLVPPKIAVHIPLVVEGGHQFAGPTVRAPGIRRPAGLPEDAELVGLVVRGEIGKGGAGSYTWKIPASQAAGTDYRIRVTGTTQAAKRDVSNKVFRIKA